MNGLILEGEDSQFRGLVVGRWKMLGWRTNVRGKTRCNPRIINRWRGEEVGPALRFKEMVYVKNM